MKERARESSAGYQMAAQLPSALLSLERAGALGHCCVCPGTRLLSWLNTGDKDPSSPRGLCGSLAVKVREGYDTHCMSGV